MAKKAKPIELSEEEKQEHVVAQESHAFYCGKNFKRDGIVRVFHDPRLQAIYEEGKKHGA